MVRAIGYLCLPAVSTEHVTGQKNKKTWRFVSVDPDRAGKRKDNAIAGTQNPDAYPAARYYRTLLNDLINCLLLQVL